MMLGMSFVTFTILHVVISLIGIASGIAVLLGMLNDRKLDGATNRSTRRSAACIAACITDDMVQAILNDLSSLKIDSIEIAQEDWRWAVQARPDLSLLFGAYFVDYAPLDVDGTPETLFIQRGAVGTLELAGQPSDGDRFIEMMRGIVGKRLTYRRTDAA